ncbi:MAG: two-component sensor histidine kinase [Clostridia bacterium]|nr:two-component sensor histidine kinase [Clostridia bacterium]
MKKRRLSIAWSIYLYLLLFAALILSVLWLCQVVFLDDIYKSVKMREIHGSAQDIVNNIDSNELGDAIDRAGVRDICVSVADMERRIYLFKHHSLDSCAIHSIDNESIFTLFHTAQANGGSCTQRFMYDSARRKYIGIDGDLFDNSQFSAYKGELPESIIYTEITKNKDGDTLFIILNSEITPVGATVSTLNRILSTVTAVTVLLALVLALVISYGISRPLVRLTREAKKLGSENATASFDENGYREVAQLSEALEHASKELKQTADLRRELIANISHDLRTPLTMIGGYAEMMRDLPGENNAENTQVIIDEAARLSTLVNDLLDISKLQSGTENMEVSCFDLTLSVKATLERFDKLCEHDGCSIEFIYDGDAYVVSDEKRITRVIYNLVSNALIHNGSSKQLEVRQIINPDSVRIEVTDHGKGIAPEMLPLIWDRYYKVDPGHKRTTGGSGLGLSIVKAIMEQAGGGYGVTSTVGEGSTFFIELERVEVDNSQFSIFNS